MITPAGVSTILGTTGTRPQGITIDSSGNIYTANTGSSNVSKITPAGVSTILAATGTGPRHITIDSSGRIYTANITSNNVSKITVLGPPAFTLSSSSESKTVNTAISGYTITSTGGTIVSYAISPAAPAGLTFNTTTGLLSGTPTSVAAATVYTITATNTSGTAQRTFTLTVRPIAPAFTISSASESKTVNTAITGYTISSTGGAIASYAISPAAPAGLTFNTTTGLLTGTPTEVAAATAYTITATNATSSTTQTFTLTVTAVPVAPNNADNSAAQAEAARRANEQRQMGDLSSVLPLINELIKEIEDGLKSTSAPKKKITTSKTKQSSQAKPDKKSNSEPLTIPVPPVTEPEAQSQVGELVSVSHKVGFGLSASWINSSNIKALRGFIAGIEESLEVERIVIHGYAQPTKIGLSDIDIARANAVKKFLSKEGLDYPMIVEGMGQAESKKGDLSRLAVVIVEGKLKNQN
jgi:outer membrane protein OmpA-like peptidoglycan-associated protein